MLVIGISLVTVSLTYENINYTEKDNAIFSLYTIILKYCWHQILLDNLINKILSI